MLYHPGGLVPIELYFHSFIYSWSSVRFIYLFILFCCKILEKQKISHWKGTMKWCARRVINKTRRSDIWIIIIHKLRYFKIWCNINFSGVSDINLWEYIFVIGVVERILCSCNIFHIEYFFLAGCNFFDCVSLLLLFSVVFSIIIIIFYFLFLDVGAFPITSPKLAELYFWASMNALTLNNISCKTLDFYHGYWMTSAMPTKIWTKTYFILFAQYNYVYVNIVQLVKMYILLKDENNFIT